jgi:threonylcarbamoyladenosine tRNA methylthiotransferase MtaB
MRFAGIHVFPYSQRAGTVAFQLPDQVPDPVKKQRVHRLISLAQEMSADYRNRFLGSTVPVLWETRRALPDPVALVPAVPLVPSVPAGEGRGGIWEGLTDTYVRVRTFADADLTNRLTPALLTAARDDGLWAEVNP